jgi:hypothetical protein
MLFDPGHDHLLSGYFGLPRSGWLTEPSTYTSFPPRRIANAPVQVYGGPRSDDRPRHSDLAIQVSRCITNRGAFALVIVPGVARLPGDQSSTRPACIGLQRRKPQARLPTVSLPDTSPAHHVGPSRLSC